MRLGMDRSLLYQRVAGVRRSANCFGAHGVVLGSYRLLEEPCPSAFRNSPNKKRATSPPTIESPDDGVLLVPPPVFSRLYCVAVIVPLSRLQFVQAGQRLLR